MHWSPLCSSRGGVHHQRRLHAPRGRQVGQEARHPGPPDAVHLPGQRARRVELHRLHPAQRSGVNTLRGTRNEEKLNHMRWSSNNIWGRKYQRVKVMWTDYGLKSIDIWIISSYSRELDGTEMRSDSRRWDGMTLSPRSPSLSRPVHRVWEHLRREPGVLQTPRPGLHDELHLPGTGQGPLEMRRCRSVNTKSQSSKQNNSVSIVNKK